MTESKKYKGTGWAIFFALLTAPLFYYFYELLFNAVISFYSKYDPSFSYGLGALIFKGFGSNIFSFLSASASVVKAFPEANKEGIFYGLSSLIIFMAIISFLAEIKKFDWSLTVVIVNALICILTVFAIRIVLTNPEND